MKVLLVDDNRLMLEGLQNMLEANNIEVAGIALNGLEAVAKTRELKPDVILMDIRMPKCDGLAATRLIKAEMPERNIVILTTSTEDNDLFEAVKSGACGYLVKSIDSEELVEAIYQVQQNIPPFSPGLAAKLLKEFAHLSQAPTLIPPKGKAETDRGALAGGLNERQVEVLKLAAQGLSYKEIGGRLSLSPSTIKYHMSEIMNRLHLANRSQVLTFAGQLGWKPDRPNM